MKYLTILLAAGFVLFSNQPAGAMTNATYGLLQESLFSVFSLACLVLALVLFLSLRGGSLGIPWLFFMLGFGLASVGGALRVLDLLQIVVHNYDLRPAFLVTRAGTMLFMLVGLVLYKRGLR